MKKSYLFAGLLLGAMLSAVALGTPNVTGKWSGTFHRAQMVRAQFTLKCR